MIIVMNNVKFCILMNRWFFIKFIAIVMVVMMSVMGKIRMQKVKFCTLMNRCFFNCNGGDDVCDGQNENKKVKFCTLIFSKRNIEIMIIVKMLAMMSVAVKMKMQKFCTLMNTCFLMK